MRLFLGIALVVLLALSVLVPPAAAEEGGEEKAPNSILAKYDKGFRFTTRRRYALRINGLLQVRWTYVDYDPDDPVQPGGLLQLLRPPRAALLFRPRRQPAVHLPRSTSSSNRTRAQRQRPLGRVPSSPTCLSLGVGRNKISYGLEMLNSGSALGMVERSLMYGETDIDLGSALSAGAAVPGRRHPPLRAQLVAPTRVRHRRPEPLPVAGRSAPGRDAAPTPRRPSSTSSACGRARSTNAAVQLRQRSPRGAQGRLPPVGLGRLENRRRCRRQRAFQARGHRIGILRSRRPDPRVSTRAATTSPLLARWRGLVGRPRVGDRILRLPGLRRRSRSRRVGGRASAGSSFPPSGRLAPATPRSSG